MLHGIFDRPREKAPDDRETLLIRAGLEEGWDETEFALALGIPKEDVARRVREILRKSAMLPMG